MNAIECLSPERLAPILERKRSRDIASALPRFPLDILLISILEKANEFVPSVSGSILLDDPILKSDDLADRKELVFVCCFGPAARSFIGERISIEKGIVGAVYRTGIAHVTNEAYGDAEFAGEFDRRSGYSTRSVLCVPIRIGGSICGVIELLNRQGEQGYRETEKELLEIFAQYISSTIQNALDAKRIATMVRRDDLTGLSNDRHLHERLPPEVANAFRGGQPLSVIFLDLDRFKEINDRHGHLAGSATLAEFGRVLRDAVQSEDALLVRYGGDEFVVILPATGRETALAIAESIRTATESHVFLSAPWGDHEAPLHLGGIVTASLGVSTLKPLRGRRLDETPLHAGMRLLQTADKAMYLSKSRGKNAATPLPFDVEAPGENGQR
ncbi:MAG TPA: sensor domain-containing diguanylate cyclase [Thermoanaerobaculia bacterium]